MQHPLRTESDKVFKCEQDRVNDSHHDSQHNAQSVVHGAVSGGSHKN